MANFDDAIDVILEHEGGYVNHPADPAGETRFGITKRNYPALDIKTLTKEQAKEIYRRDYWARMFDFIIDQKVATKVFDMTVNMGKSQATRIVQRAIRVNDDGVFGPVTLRTLNNTEYALNAICAEQEKFYRKLAEKKPQLSVFLNGWLKRAKWGQEVV